MALQGTISGTTANSYITARITWSAVQSISGNYSDITATLSYSRTNSGYTTEGDWTGALSIGSDTGTVSSVHLKITQNSNTAAITHTARVYHDSYGRLSLTISAEGRIYNPSSSTLKSTAVGAAVTLDTIPRASAVSAVSADIGSRSTVVISRKNDAFTHSIAYSFGTLSGYLDADGSAVSQLTRLSATTVNFLLPESFYYQIPNASSGVCTLTCTTWSGTTQIGQPQTAQFTVTAAQALCEPVVSGTVVDVNDVTATMTEDPGKLIRFLSTARCTISAQSRYGATITQLRINGTAVTDTVLDIPNAELDTVEFQATDSRGYTVTCRVTPEIIPYIQLTNNASVQRTDPTGGNAVLTLQGSCWKGTFGAVDNILEIEYQVGGEEPVYLTPRIADDSSYCLTVELSGLDYQTSHSIRVTVMDLQTAVEKTLTVSKGIPVFDWGEEDFRFNVPVELPGLTVNGQSLESYIRSIVQGG